jgi:hypothetical protein
VKNHNKATVTKGTKPGPKPQVLKIKGNWERAVTKSFKKKKPPEGWPK